MRSGRLYAIRAGVEGDGESATAGIGVGLGGGGRRQVGVREYGQMQRPAEDVGSGNTDVARQLLIDGHLALVHQRILPPWILAARGGGVGRQRDGCYAWRQCTREGSNWRPTRRREDHVWERQAGASDR